MLKRNITYEDYDGNTVTETFYFNLSKAELVELEFSTKEGFGDTMKRIIKTEDMKELIAIFKDLVLNSYGKKSEDGKRFIKSPEMRLEFSQTAAYNQLFMELATNADAAAAFSTGVIPKDMGAELEKQIQTQTPEGILAKAKEDSPKESAFDQMQRVAGVPSSPVLPPPNS